MWLGIGVVSLLIFLSCIWSFFEWISIASIIAFALVCTVTEAFCLNFFLFAFSGVGLNFIVGIIATLVSVLIRYIIDVVKKRKKIFKWPLLVTALIIFIYSFVGKIKNYAGFEAGMMIIYVFALAYFVFVYHKEINIAKCFNFALLGFVIAAGISGLIILFDVEYEIFIYDGKYDRLKLLSYHMNNISIHCVFQVVYSIYSLLNKKRRIWIDICAIIFSLILGVLTLSKAFLLMIAFVVIYAVICMIVKFKKRAIIPFFVTCGICVFLIVVGWSYISSIIDRFFITYSDASLFSMITSGRMEIWNTYRAHIKSSLKNTFIGVGLFANDLYNQLPHSIPLFLLYRFGVVGIVLIGVLVASYIFESKSKLKFTLFNCLLLIVWLLFSLEEIVLSDQFAIYLYISFILLVKDSCQTNNENVKINMSNDGTGEVNETTKSQVSHKKDKNKIN